MARGIVRFFRAIFPEDRIAIVIDAKRARPRASLDVLDKTQRPQVSSSSPSQAVDLESPPFVALIQAGVHAGPHSERARSRRRQWGKIVCGVAGESSVSALPKRIVSYC